MIDDGQRWTLASTAIALLHADPTLNGMLVRSSYGPVQTAYLDTIQARFTTTRIPVSVSLERLNGGLDISQTLSAGKPVFQPGLLQTNDTALLINGAERLDSMTTSVLTAHLDRAEPRSSVLILMDESADSDTALPDSALADRLALMLELPSLPVATLRSLVDNNNSLFATSSALDKGSVDAVAVSDDIVQELIQLTDRLGVSSMRALLFAIRVAKVHAALHERATVSVEDAAVAAQLVLAPRANCFDSDEPSEDQLQENEQPPSDETAQDPPDNATSSPENDPQPETDKDPTTQEAQDMGEQLLEAAAATLPQHVIADLVKGQKNNRTTGRDTSATSSSGSTGRPAGVRRPRGGLRNQRLNLIETLKAAAPKQRLRGNAGGKGQRLQIRLDDFRITRYKQPTRTTTVFVVDASGSAALHRLAEAKGAVELLLAECYVRRDRVAMISFRGDHARLELPPTRSLVRAKRELAGLPGGGGTPLAAGLDLATQVVQQLKQAGEAPVVVVMTDAKANIARDGSASRAQAMEDAHQAARLLAATEAKCLMVDTAPRARPQARELAISLNARYLPLPSLQAQTLPQLVNG